MSVIARIEKTYNCLMNFRDHSSDEYKKLIDIFIPMLYKENKYHLDISVGEKVSLHKFKSMLSVMSRNFYIGLECFNNEPQLTIKDLPTQHVITLLNFELIKNLQIESEYIEDNNFCRHNIYFKYKNKVDYCIHIATAE